MRNNDERPDDDQAPDALAAAPPPTSDLATRREAQVRALKATVAARDERIGVLKRDLIDARNRQSDRIEKLQSQVSSLKEMVANRDRKMVEGAARASEAAALQKQVATLQKRIAALQEQIATLQERIATYRERIAARDGRIESLTTTIREKQAALVASSARLADLKTRQADERASAAAREDRWAREREGLQSMIQNRDQRFAELQERFGEAVAAAGDRSKEEPLDWLFVTAPETRGWILDAICREIGRAQPGTWNISYGEKRLPPARAYFFSHYLLFLHALARNPELAEAQTLVWYTHPREIGVAVDEQIAAFRQASRVVLPCSMFRDALVEQGLPAEKTAFVLGAADPEVFLPHPRGSGLVGLSSAFYERKNPDRLLEIVRLAPHRRFSLLGRGWEAYERWDELSSLPNFSYDSPPYAEYPARYAAFDVFLSLSRVEGGPIPLIETMMTNAVPVVSRTGFAPDVIRHGENGYIFDVDAPAEQIVELIDRALVHQGDISSSVRHLTWSRFAREIRDLVTTTQ